MLLVRFAVRCWPRRLPCPAAPRFSLVLLGIVLLTPAWQGPAPAADEPAPPRPPSAQEVSREHLLAMRDDLQRRADEAYKNGQPDTALQLLEQLFPLYEQLYPPAEYPTGCVEVARTYQRMCGIAKAKGDVPQLGSLAAKGIAACFPLGRCCESPDLIETAAVLRSYSGVACFNSNDLKNARNEFISAAELHNRAVKLWDSRVSRGLLPDVYESLAQISIDLNDLSAADIYLGHALDSLMSLAQATQTMEIMSRTAACSFWRGTVARRRGNYIVALECAQTAESYALQLYLVTRTQQDLVALVRTTTLSAVLQKEMGNEETARTRLESVLGKLIPLSCTDTSLSEQLEVVVCNLLQIAVTQKDEFAVEQFCSFLKNRVAKRRCCTAEVTDKTATAELLRNIGVAFFELGNNAAAEETLCMSLAVLEESKGSADPTSVDVQEAVIRNDLGRLYSVVGRHDEAGAEYWAALKLAKSPASDEEYRQCSPLLATLFHNYASHCWLIGETDAAAALFGQAFEISRAVYSAEQYPNGHPRLLQAYSGWCSVLVRERRLTEAEKYAEEVNRLLVNRMKTGWSRSTADELAASWVDLGRIRRARGDVSAARDFFGRALESYEARGAGQNADGQLSIALVLAEIGRTYAEERDFSAALTYLRRSLDMRRRLFPAAEYPQGHPSLANALRDTGITCLLAGECGQAYEFLAEAARIEHAIGESFFGGASEAQLLNLAARKFQSLGPLLLAWKETGLPADAVYAYVWKRHGFVPRLIAQRQRQLRQWARRNDAALYETYLHKRQDLARALLVSITDDLQGRATRLTQLERLNRDKEELEQQLTDAFELADESGDASKAVEALRHALPGNAAFIDFYAHASLPFDATLPSRAGRGEVDRLVAFVVTRDRPVTFIDLGDPRPLASLVDTWQNEIERDIAPVDGLALREKIWDPVAAALPPDIDTVYIAPDGPVTRVAWSALPCPGELGVLLERYAIATVPHGAFLLDELMSPAPSLGQGKVWISDIPHRGVAGDERSEPPECQTRGAHCVGPQSPRHQPHHAIPTRSTAVLVIADVDYGDPEADEAKTRDGLKQLRWPPLAASRRELDTIVDSLGNRDIIALTGCQASTTAVVEGLGRARLAHLATHGFFLEDSLTEELRLAAKEQSSPRLEINSSRASFLARSPFLRSGLALAGANRPAAVGVDGLPHVAEGILTAEAVAALDAEQLDLVVLSACDTTRGDVAAGEGVLGIQTAFHIAGARNVISGLWKIPDDAAADLMTEFYRLLAQPSVPPLAALRGAQLALARQAVPTVGQARGAELASTVPLPARKSPPVPQWCRGARRWAGFSLSGPGF